MFERREQLLGILRRAVFWDISRGNVAWHSKERQLFCECFYLIVIWDNFFLSDQSFKCYSSLGGQPLLWFWTRFAAVDETQRFPGDSQRQGHETLGGVDKKSYRQEGSNIFLINCKCGLDCQLFLFHSINVNDHFFFPFQTNSDNDIAPEITFEKEPPPIEWHIAACNDIERFDLLTVRYISGYFFGVVNNDLWCF